jgi:ferric-chelate reductase
LTIAGVSALSIEAHPFTISTIDPGIHVVDGPGYFTEPGGRGEMDATTVSHSKEGFKQLVFLVKVRDGFTKRLLHAAGLWEDQIMRVLVDGPYGSPPLLGGYDVVILIAGALYPFMTTVTDVMIDCIS